MTCIAVPECPPAWPMSRRVDLRYLGVLAIWAGLFVIRPRLALLVLAERRADSPIPRRRSAGRR